MTFGACVLMLLFGLFACLIALMIYTEAYYKITSVVSGIFSILFGVVAVVGLSGMCLWGCAENKVEAVHLIPVSEIDGVQYIQYQHPDYNAPTIINVNERFKRSFIAGDDVIEVTIYSKGPYNGIYERPRTKIALPAYDLKPVPAKVHSCENKLTTNHVERAILEVEVR